MRGDRYYRFAFELMERSAEEIARVRRVGEPTSTEYVLHWLVTRASQGLFEAAGDLWILEQGLVWVPKKPIRDMDDEKGTGELVDWEGLTYRFIRNPNEE